MFTLHYAENDFLVTQSEVAEMLDAGMTTCPHGVTVHGLYMPWREFLADFRFWEGELSSKCDDCLCGDHAACSGIIRGAGGIWSNTRCKCGCLAVEGE